MFMRLSIVGRVFLQSDIESVTAEMRDNFEEFGHEFFELADQHQNLRDETQYHRKEEHYKEHGDVGFCSEDLALHQVSAALKVHNFNNQTNTLDA